jgi:ElaB/YqjD/DUF883 family membrane-anchored ribosome-binding protein
MSESTTEVNDSATTTVEELRALIREAEQALGSGSSAGDEIDELRERLRDAIADGQNLVGKLSDNLRRQARRADEAIRANPYQTAGIAAGVGLLVGFLLSRRGRSD